MKIQGGVRKLLRSGRWGSQVQILPFHLTDDVNKEIANQWMTNETPQSNVNIRL
jgi:hypothetical protein